MLPYSSGHTVGPVAGMAMLQGRRSHLMVVLLEHLAAAHISWLLLPDITWGEGNSVAGISLIRPLGGGGMQQGWGELWLSPVHEV